MEECQKKILNGNDGLLDVIGECKIEKPRSRRRILQGKSISYTHLQIVVRKIILITKFCILQAYDPSYRMKMNITTEA